MKKQIKISEIIALVNRENEINELSLSNRLENFPLFSALSMSFVFVPSIFAPYSKRA